MRLRIDQINRSGDIVVILQNTAGIEDYSQFLIVVRKNEIVKYEFRNICLTPNHFHYWCRYVSGLFLCYLKAHCGSHIFVETEFEDR